jgi:cysteinyl-tRNA synthetase
MQAPKVYSTLTRTLQELEPRCPGKVNIYCCGPTVYDVPHVGHARAALMPDVLVRVLRARGFAVTYVRNITDVDDKILDRARSTGEPPLELSRRMADVYCEQMAALGCVAPDHEPRVSQHIAPIIALVETLLENGSAYAVTRGAGTQDVLFSVRSFPGYGKLSRRNIDELVAGARVERDEAKRDPLDFALWKGATEDEWGWDSPWGRGRPGWHIECSAMSQHYLRDGVDVHAGGMDLIFPHHENEIAQSEAAHPESGPFARYWLHNGFVNVDKEKMSKSLNNFVSVSDVLAHNDPEAFRWFLLCAHYRGPIQFDTEPLPDGGLTFPGIDEAERRVDYMYSTIGRLREREDETVPLPQALPKPLLSLRPQLAKLLEQAQEALGDDLNTPVAIAALGELARVGNEVADGADRHRKDRSYVAGAALLDREVLGAIETVAGWLGVLRADPALYAARTRARRLALRGLTEQAVEELVAERTAARRSKDFARSDAIRAQLEALKISVRDLPSGTEWTAGV